MLLKGFKFGMMLQLAIGPVCMYIFSLGSNQGFIGAETGVLAVALVDAIYVLLAILGITAFIKNDQVQKIFKVLGAVIIMYFGISIIAGVFGLKITPDISLFAGQKSGGSFTEGFLLTASNPLTILFWTGVFSTKISAEKLQQREIYLFGTGAFLATFLFLSAIALVGSITSIFISGVAVKVLNVFVGLILIYFAVTKIINSPHQELLM